MPKVYMVIAPPSRTSYSELPIGTLITPRGKVYKQKHYTSAFYKVGRGSSKVFGLYPEEFKESNSEDLEKVPVLPQVSISDGDIKRIDV